jgi:hypothetical protein
MMSESAIELALRCYPGWWRERYANEVRVVSNDLTAEGRSPVRVAWNLLGGAIRARSRAQGMPKTHGLWSARTRASITAATLPWLVVAPLVLTVMGHQTFHSSAGTVISYGLSFAPTHLQIVNKHVPPTPAPPLTPIAPLIMWAGLAVGVLVLVTFTILISGWSGLTSAIRRSSTPHRRRLRLLAWAPVFSLLTDVALWIAQAGAHPDNFHSTRGGLIVASGGNPAALHVLDIVVPIVVSAGWLASIACVAVAARRADVAPSDLRFGKSVAIIVASLFIVLVAAYATWSVGLIVQARQAAHGNYTTIVYSHAGLWLPTVTVLVVGVILSGMGARAARSSWKVISVTVV